MVTAVFSAALTRISRWTHSMPRFDPMALCEALVAVTSGVLVWIGLWDLVEEVVPNVWWLYVLMILVGATGLYCMRQLYDRQQEAAASVEEVLERMRKHGEQLSDARTGASECTRTSELLPQDAARSATAGQEPMDIEGAADAATRQQPPMSVPQRRTYFDAPEFDAGKCGRSLCAISFGLVLWVGIWDLVDYHVVPTLTSVFVAQHNGSALGVCEHASDEQWGPGMTELATHPGCALTKLLLFAVGILGLFATRSLYGTARAKREATFARLP